jgi:hypothetical protein
MMELKNKADMCISEFCQVSYLITMSIRWLFKSTWPLSGCLKYPGMKQSALANCGTTIALYISLFAYIILRLLILKPSHKLLNILLLVT